MEFRLPPRCNSGTVLNRPSGSTLAPRPPDDEGRFPDDTDREGDGPTLADRRGRGRLLLRGTYPGGIAGIGGGSGGVVVLVLELGLRGEWSRNVRELIELELRARRRPSRLDGRRGLGNPEDCEVTEARRWTMRLV